MYSKLAKAIRIITVAPIMALALFIILFIKQPFIFSGQDFLAAIGFIAIFPICAYPLHKLFPKLPSPGRAGERQLAIIMSNIGYVLGLLYVMIAKVNASVFIIFVAYACSGFLVFLINKVTPIRASGHACGVSGCFALATYFFGWIAVPGFAVLILVYIASISMKRHTSLDFIVGALIPAAAMAIALLAAFIFKI